jgi:hypothetical protein
MQFFQTAQPALLYICPAIMIGQFFASVYNKTVSTMWHWSEDKIVEEGREKVRENEDVDEMIEGRKLNEAENSAKGKKNK